MLLSACSTPSRITRWTCVDRFAGLDDADVVERIAVAVVQGVLVPFRGQERREGQRVDLEPKPQQILEQEPIHPAGGSGVPGPAAPAFMPLGGVDVRRDHVGLDLVRRCPFGRVGMPDGIEHREQPPRLFGIAQPGHGHDGPDRGMGVLPAILSNAGDIAPNVAGVQLRAVEWRIEQADRRRIRVDQPLQRGLQRLP